MEDGYCKKGAITSGQDGVHAKDRHKVTSRPSSMKRLADLEAEIKEIKVSINSLKETRMVLPICICLKEGSKGRSLICMLEGDVSDPKAFRQRIMND